MKKSKGLNNSGST